MRAVGIVAEYNPFHNGHAYHLAEAKKRSGAEIAVAVMSGWFTQRGDAAVLPPRVRAEAALKCGADAVFLLPACWAVRDAEHFALAGVSLLERLGCDALSFGVETDDLLRLQAVASVLEDEPEAFREELRGALDKGMPHPQAVAEAADVVIPGAAAVLREPNNTLAICYLRALHRLNSAMTPVPVPRLGQYRDPNLHPAHPSATAMRLALWEGREADALQALPGAAADVLTDALADGWLQPPEALDRPLRARLLTMTEADWAALPGRSEGVEDRLRKAARQTAPREAMLTLAGTRRYTHARLNRMLTHALLGVTQEDLDAALLPPAACLLGLNAGAAPLLRRAQENGLPVIGKAADWKAWRDQPWVRIEERAADLWSVGAGKPAGLMYSQGMAKGL